MEIGFVGLGRMGGNMVRRLQKGDHKCHIYSETAETRNALASETGAAAHADLASLVAVLSPPRAIWVMVPAGEATSTVLGQLQALCSAGDIVIDGGNSHYKLSAARSKVVSGVPITP